jgi:nucleoside-diphosphate-sugar epimerase
VRSASQILDVDRELLVERTRPLFESVRGSRFFVTGGTGFFGCWILETLTAANDELGLGLSATVLSRNPEAFQVRAPHLATHSAVHLLPGDVRTMVFPPGGFDFVIHAAFDSSREPGPDETRSTIVEGTARCLELARRAGARKFLFLSSGAVYGRQPTDLSHVPEEYFDDPASSDSLSPYGEAKRAAEALCLRTATETGLEVKIARGFAFVGPHMPLDAHFAIGNFIRDALAGGPIRIRGDGTAIRSYLYAAELAVWLLTILLRGKSGTAYNVGSEEEVTVSELARRVASVSGPGIRIEIASKPSGSPSERYVPSTRRARQELGLEQEVGLEEAIRRTTAWYLGVGKGPQGDARRTSGPR